MLLLGRAQDIAVCVVVFPYPRCHLFAKHNCSSQFFLPYHERGTLSIFILNFQWRFACLNLENIQFSERLRFVKLNLKLVASFWMQF